VRADTPAVTLTSPGETYSGDPFTLGFEFTVSQSVSVTALGVYDADIVHGLANPAQVGIWDVNGNLLASTTVPAGTGGTLIDNFLYSSIAPLSLTAGVDYVVGAHVNDTATSFNTDQGGAGSYNSVVTGIQDRFSENGSLTFPDLTDGHPGGAWLGGNFLIGTNSVPEPSSIVMATIAFLAGLGYTLRRSRVKRAG
jgi:Domain of unknown function (DUF4082)